MPGPKQPSPTPDDSRERVIAAATTLFAEHGYDGTSTRQIANQVGLNVATVAYHVGAKADLYQEVMRRAYAAEAQHLTRALAAFHTAAAADPAAAVRTLVGAYFDFCLAHAHIPALWMRRWLSDAAEVIGPEAEYAKPQIDAVRAAVEAALPEVAACADVEMTVWTVLWMTHGFCCSGLLDQDGTRRGPTDPQAVDRFRTHLEGLALRELGLGLAPRLGGVDLGGAQ
ncbi:TetR/AcrR family transcriptional regulator [Actinospica durhamensis]|uniref:TetR/AcrR family transcriptional regulator n=1 Tax=Actinospica durhamensis TaxID=1508375 RepID=A0A941ER09_9ACTN|nr:TetR/AcrR family transcriptional regulator [Actinospica durhamensis]MBR7836870.1 TetR/AcrR family transcriptional regulator [Actinospica durhamensis]